MRSRGTVQAGEQTTQSACIEPLLDKQAQEKRREKQYVDDVREDVKVYRPRVGTANGSKRCDLQLLLPSVCAD